MIVVLLHLDLMITARKIHEVISARYGFSLIEILIVVGIMLTLTGFIIASYSSFTSTQKLKQAVKTLRSDLRFVQTRAASGLKPSGVCENLVSYQVSFTSSSYSYQPVCTISGDPTPTNPVTTITLPDQVSFSLPIPPILTFKVLTGVANRDATITLSNGGTSRVLVISKSGDISEQ